jgi:hypothetical protein
MSNVNYAKLLDSMDQTVESSIEYEKLISDSIYELDCLINLSFLYWNSTDYGFNSAKNLSLEFIHFASNRYLEILDIIDKVYENHPVSKFWRLYFNMISFGEDNFESQCMEIIKDERVTLDPYFYLYLMSHNSNFTPQVSSLVLHCNENPSHKSRYILAVLGEI